MSKKTGMKARGIRFTNEQWLHLQAMAGGYSTPSDYTRLLVQKDLDKQKVKRNGKATALV